MDLFTAQFRPTGQVTMLSPSRAGMWDRGSTDNTSRTGGNGYINPGGINFFGKNTAAGGLAPPPGSANQQSDGGLSNAIHQSNQENSRLMAQSEQVNRMKEQQTLQANIMKVLHEIRMIIINAIR